MRYNEFKPLNELNMSPASLSRFVNSGETSEMVAGFEAEFVFPVFEDDGNAEYSPDLYMNYRFGHDIDLDEIKEFFQFSNRDQGAMRPVSDGYDSYVDSEFEEYSDKNMSDYRTQTREENPNLSDDEIEDKAAESMMNQYYQNDAPELYDYLRTELGLMTMHDISNEFGLTWPHWLTDSNSSTVIQLADSLGSVVGSKVDASSDYHATPRSNNWIIEPDGSIKCNSDEVGLEVISPPMPIKETLSKLEAVLEWATYENASTNHTTGLHVGMSFDGYGTHAVDYVKLALFLGDRYVLKQFLRASNEYTRSSMSVIDDVVNSNETFTDKSIETLLFGMRKGLLQSASRAIMVSNPHRNTSINMRPSYVEFRSMGDDYISRYIDIKNTIMRYAQAYAVASNPDAYKNEYAKKLYKLINPTNNDLLQLFVDFARGEIGSTSLVYALRNKQKIKQRMVAPQ